MVWTTAVSIVKDLNYRGPFLKIQKFQKKQKISLLLHFLLVVIVSMESQFRSYELKAYSSGLAHQSSSSSYCDSLLQKRTYQTFTEDDFFEEVEEEKESCEPLEKESSIGSGSPQSNDDGIKGKFVLSNEKFPTFQLAFQWGVSKLGFCAVLFRKRTSSFLKEQVLFEKNTQPPGLVLFSSVYFQKEQMSEIQNSI